MQDAVKTKLLEMLIGLANAKLALNISTVGKLPAASSNGSTNSLPDQQTADDICLEEEWSEISEDFSCLSAIPLNGSPRVTHSTSTDKEHVKPLADEKSEEVIDEGNFEDLVEECCTCGDIASNSIGSEQEKKLFYPIGTYNPMRFVTEKKGKETPPDVITNCDSTSVESNVSSSEDKSLHDHHLHANNSTPNGEEILKQNNFEDLQSECDRDLLNTRDFESDQSENEFHDLGMFSLVKYSCNGKQKCVVYQGKEKPLTSGDNENSEQEQGDFQELEDLDVEEEMIESEITSCGENNLEGSNIQHVGSNCSGYWEASLERLGDFHNWEDNEYLNKDQDEIMDLENQRERTQSSIDWGCSKYSGERTANEGGKNVCQVEASTNRDNAFNIPSLEADGLEVEIATAQNSHDRLRWESNSELEHSADFAYTDQKLALGVGCQQEVHFSSLGTASGLDDFSHLECFS